MLNWSGPLPSISACNTNLSRPAGPRLLRILADNPGPDKGTGLGLSICKTIIEDLGGNIRFTSDQARGTTFRITFPLCTSREEEKNGNSRSVQNPGGG
ncbi:MAG: ATP-binding protein [Desulfobacterales bacterium]